MAGQGEETSAQAAARAAFAQEKTEGFYSSDDDDDTHSSASLSTTTSTAGGLKLKVCLCESGVNMQCTVRISRLLVVVQLPNAVRCCAGGYQGQGCRCSGQQ